MNLTSSPAWFLAIACLLTFLAALAGGLLPALFRLTHTRLQLAVSPDERHDRPLSELDLADGRWYPRDQSNQSQPHKP
jgi:hypothetical protein